MDAHGTDRYDAAVCNNPANLPYQKQRFIFNYVLNITSDLAGTFANPKRLKNVLT